MKLFFKVLLFTFTMMTTVGAVKSSTVAGTLQEETSYSFFQKSQFATIVSKNIFNSSYFECLKYENILHLYFKLSQLILFTYLCK